VKVGILPTLALYRTPTRLRYRHCDVVGVDYKEYLLRGDEAVYMAFIDWIAAMAKQKGRQKSHQTYKNYWKWLSEYYALHNQKSIRSCTLKSFPYYRKEQSDCRFCPASARPSYYHVQTQLGTTVIMLTTN
jgi:hypothetical protein